MKDRKEELKAITDKLEQGTRDVFESGRFEAYLKSMSKFYRYSLNNCILIAIQCPGATLVAGYKKWQNEFERTVRKGEKAIRIIAPVPKKFTKIVKDPVTGEDMEEEHKLMTYRSVPVFDISQTEGKELPEISHNLEGDEGAELIGKVLAVSPVPIRFEAVPGAANGFYSYDGYIVVDDSLSPSHKLKTLVHEIAHATIHCKGGEQEKADRGAMEVQAESVAFTVCSYFGIDTSDYSFGYVAGWSEGKELEELRNSLDVIRKTAGEMIDGIEAAGAKAA